jgi:Tn3 transposase DDE domain
MRTLRIDDRPTKLAQAVAELGRIDKAIHSLTYIDDESKRRRTLTQLNRGEDRHKLARAVFHGKRGELRQRYREGQEDQLGALGLVVNIHRSLEHTLYRCGTSATPGRGLSSAPGRRGPVVSIGLRTRQSVGPLRLFCAGGSPAWTTSSPPQLVRSHRGAFLIP